MKKIKPTISDCCKAAIQTGKLTDICAAKRTKDYHHKVRRLPWTHREIDLPKQEYIGQRKDVIDSVPMHFDEDGDMIAYSRHKRFSDSYKNLVKNPEYAL